MTRARFASESKVRIIKAPKEAPHLLGKVGKVVYPAKQKGGICCVLIGNNFTHLKESDLERG